MSQDPNPLEERLQIEILERARAEQTVRFQKAQLALRDFEGDDFSDFLKLASRECSHALQVERAGIWFFDGSREAIVCQSLFLRSENRHQAGLRLDAKNYPAYFKALLSLTSIIAVDAFTNPATSEFADPYLKPLGISSMLDVPIRLGAELLGVICCEQVGAQRSWTTEEEKFAIAMAGSIFLGLEKKRRREIESELRSLNENLEHIIAERTAELQASEEHFRAVTESAHDAIVSADDEGQIISWNRGAATVFGYHADEVMGRPLSILMPESYRPMHAAGLKRFTQTGEAHVIGKTVELHGLRKDGTEFPLELSLESWTTTRGRFFTGILRDISERKRVYSALVESEERFRQFTEQSNEVFWFIDRNPERVLYVSPAVMKVWGVPASVFYKEPRSWFKAIHPDEQQRVGETLYKFIESQESTVETEYRVIRPDGTTCWVQASCTAIRNAEGYITRFATIARDITDRKQNELHLLRTQRLESIGTLAGGVAHDLNNALAPILLVVELLRRMYPGSHEMLNTIERSAQRGSGMVRQLLTFARGVEGERLVVHPISLFQEMEKIIVGTFPKNIELRTHYSEGTWDIRGDATQLHQVLLNLSVNSRDAMPNGGILTLEAHNVVIDQAYTNLVPEATPGRYVMLKVSDTGTGIPKSVIDRIFEPFFTTKDPDRGTGLGLSTLIGIVRSHGGFVRVYSAENEGSSFAVHLPAETVLSADEVQGEEQNPKFRGNGETILVVDDEPNVRLAATSVLESLNLKVLTAADGTEALIRAAENRARIRLVITDLHMPHMDGLTLIRTLHHMLPSIPIIPASGRLEPHDLEELRRLNLHVYLEKPFTERELTEALTLALAEKQ